MSKDNEDKIKQYFEKRLSEKGYFLENKVQKLLNQYFSTVRRGAHYFDKDENTDREIDFFTYTPCCVIPPTKKQKAIIRFIEFIIECKKLPDHAWIFSGQKESRMHLVHRVDKNAIPSMLPDYVSDVELETDKSIFDYIPVITKEIFTADSYYEDFLIDKTDKNDVRSNGRADNLYAAIHRVTKATRFRIEYQKTKLYGKKKHKDFPGETIIFQPIIVFEGHMYKANPTVDEKVVLEPILFARMEKEYINDNYKEKQGDVHIVSSEWLDEYLKFMQEEYQINNPASMMENIFKAPKDRRLGIFD